MHDRADYQLTRCMTGRGDQLGVWVRMWSNETKRKQPPLQQMDSGLSEPLTMRVESIEARKMPGFSKDSRLTTSILKRSSKNERDGELAYTHGQASVCLADIKHNYQTP